jgi:WD40 repeat protein
MLVSGAEDSTARVWNSETGELVLTLPCTGWANSVVWAPDGVFIACGTSEGFVHLCDGDTGARSLTVTTEDWVQSVAWSPSSDRIVAGTYGESGRPTVWVWLAHSGEVVHKLVGHNGRINGVGINSAGSLIASASDDSTVAVWDMSTGQRVRLYNDGVGPVRSVAWAHGSNRFVCGWGDFVRIFDADKSVDFAVTVFKGHSATVLAVAWSPDDSVVMSTSSDFTIRLWTVTQAYDASAPPAFQLESPVFGLAWHQRSGVCCACASGRIVQLGVVGATGRSQLKWGKSFRRSKVIARHTSGDSLPGIGELYVEIYFVVK